MKLLCLGLGYSAQQFIKLYARAFNGIAATFRSQATLDECRRQGIAPVPVAGPELTDAMAGADVILNSAAPDANGDPFIDAMRQAPARLGGRKILYLSTVGVYGDHSGAWVDEETPPNPSSQRSRWRLAAEQDWLEFGQKTGNSVQIFRLSGIYGDGRGPLEKLIEGKSQRIIKPGQVFNRIHVEDIAHTLMAAIRKGQAGAIWNVTDDEPAPPQDVIAYAAKLMNLPNPPEVSFDQAVMTPMARSFYSENKRVSNSKLRNTLGVRLAYPTYREGIAALVESLQK